MKLLGIKMERMKEGNVLWFYFTIFPQCDVYNNGIGMDMLNTYYSEANILPNMCALNLVLGGSYRHEFKPVNTIELVRFDEGPIRKVCCGDAIGSLKGLQGGLFVITRKLLCSW